tara:strand:+ start:2014 stop:2154 length:141 start_codon:yes stop_codon:yes gene_type:complete
MQGFPIYTLKFHATTPKIALGLILRSRPYWTLLDFIGIAVKIAAIR